MLVPLVRSFKRRCIRPLNNVATNNIHIKYFCNKEETESCNCGIAKINTTI